MKKFFVNLCAGNYFENSAIEEVEYDHFDRLSEHTFIGYDGDVVPDSHQRRTREVRFSLFFEETLYDTKEEARIFLKTTLEEHLRQIEEELNPLLIKQKNIKKILSNL